jgi:hypothetical protein
MRKLLFAFLLLVPAFTFAKVTFYATFTQSPVWIQGGGRSGPENIFNAAAAGPVC